MKQGETMKNREKERGILGRLRIQLIMVVMGGGMMLAVGAASSSLVVTITPSPSGLIAVGDTNAYLVASAICSGTNVTTNSTTYSWTGGGITNTSIQSITNLGETNISLTATHTGLLNGVGYTNRGTTNITITIVGISNIIGPTNVLVGTTTYYTAVPSGASTFPSGWPKWETNGSPVSATTATIPITFPTNGTNVNIKAKVGVSSTNISVNVIKVEVKEIHFNHNTGSHSSDALNIRQDKTTPITIPEYIKGGQNKPAAYVKNSAVTVKVKFKVEPSTITSLKIKAESTDTDGSLGGLEEKTISFSGGESGLEEFTVIGNTPNKVYKSTETWNWEVTAVNGVSTPLGVFETTSGHVVYTVYQAPSSPWSNTANNDQNAWTSALEFAIVTAGAHDKTAGAALSAITSHLHAGHGLTYDIDEGSPQYHEYGVFSDSFNLTDYITKARGNIVNCYDQASAVYLLGRMLGYSTDYTFMEPFGYINTINLVGEGNCNNPFYPHTQSGQKIAGNDAVEPYRSGFANHAFVLYLNRVHDACAGPALGTQTPQQYIDATIDTSTLTESNVAGTINDCSDNGKPTVIE